MGPRERRENSQTGHGVCTVGGEMLATVKVLTDYCNFTNFGARLNFGGERTRIVRCSLNFSVSDCCHNRSMCFRIQVSF